MRWRAQHRPEAPKLRRPVRDLWAICSEIISIDHVFVAKGNQTGAISRIREVRDRFDLGDDPDLCQVESELEPYYSQFVYRLVHEPESVEFVPWLIATSRTLPMKRGGLNVVALTRPQFGERLKGGRFVGNWLVKIHNWDCPDIYDRFRLHYEPRAARYFEHWFADNLRHALTWSALVLEYAVNTAWNRKLTVHFFSDGPTRVDLDRAKSNLAAQVRELSNDYAGFVEFSKNTPELADHEKFWVRGWDFISILEDIIRRQAAALRPS